MLLVRIATYVAAAGLAWAGAGAGAGALAQPLDSTSADVGEHARKSMREQVVGAMVLTGTLVVADDGTVTAHAIDRTAEVPPEVLRHIGRHIPHWRVRSADGMPDEMHFSVRVVALPQGSGHHVLSLAGASIRMAPDRDREPTVAGRLKRPEYPRSHVANGIGGEVVMIVKLGPDGSVQDLVAEQVNLDVVGPVDEVAQVRADFAAHTAAAARLWKFRMPIKGPLANEPYLSVRVPVTYGTKPRPRYGQWMYYVPGPRQPIPWRKSDGMALSAHESDRVELVGVGPRLETALEPVGPVESGSGI